jgi:hypothetical protein
MLVANSGRDPLAAQPQHAPTLAHKATGSPEVHVDEMKALCKHLAL